ncbi:AAA family ATPase [Streptomyces sp. ME02-6987-2C]|uniref:AAA family ATPase n=1 Tax=unclassified Streptomyces TaxID=2593676 RepID=UPI00087A0F3E|nr:MULTISPECIES: AAA family ATPase [unclassified Streptomyces]MDX3367431.1 AAA family ATPase [Streptomyces sp. ME02-6987-2C]MDX3423753.1 AAA family ATPase [Streptomyces sp. ME02-6985-2c]REH20651.1 AAA domain-containing protein [Streptomyces sp. 2221.1]SDT31320.1 AAA domain-containing protein [Streptomyces sp. 2114.2]
MPPPDLRHAPGQRHCATFGSSATAQLLPTMADRYEDWDQLVAAAVPPACPAPPNQNRSPPVTTPPKKLIRIGAMGTHSTGKSLLIRRIETELRDRDIPVQRTSHLGRRAALVPLPKMQHHTVDSTRWVLATGIADEVAAAARLDDAPVRVVLSDRASWDALAYFRAALQWRGESVPRTDREALHRLACAPDPYDLLFATVLDTSLPLPMHDYDDRYRKLVDHQTHALLHEENIPYVRVTSHHASQELAIEHALQLCGTEALV